VHFVPKQQRLGADQRQLLDIFERLDSRQRQTLISFAAFLATQEGVGDEPEDKEIHEPKRIERPPEESVVKAIKRLSESYFMLERELLLDETSSLMMAHMMHGRDARSVIDELEALFARHYQNYLDSG
jgi:hypothetical protein